MRARARARPTRVTPSKPRNTRKPLFGSVATNLGFSYLLTFIEQKKCFNYSLEAPLNSSIRPIITHILSQQPQLPNPSTHQAAPTNRRTCEMKIQKVEGTTNHGEVVRVLVRMPRTSCLGVAAAGTSWRCDACVRAGCSASRYAGGKPPCRCATVGHLLAG